MYYKAENVKSFNSIVMDGLMGQLLREKQEASFSLTLLQDRSLHKDRRYIDLVFATEATQVFQKRFRGRTQTLTWPAG